MSGTALRALLMEGEKLFTAMEREALACLETLHTLQSGGIERFVAQRQEILTSIQKFDTEFNRCMTGGECATEQPSAILEEFLERLDAAVRRIVAADRLLLALAEREKRKLRSDLSAITRGRRALRGYGTKERRQLSSLDHTA